MNGKTIPIQPVPIDDAAGFRMAVEAIRQFLGGFYRAEPIVQVKAAERIAAQWLSRIEGFHDAQDFLQLVRDFTNYLPNFVMKNREALSIGYFFGGFMPTYGAACTFVDMSFAGESWEQIEAFMHHLGYGAAKTYVEQFDWAGARKKASAEAKAWIAIVQVEVVAIEAEVKRMKQLSALAGLALPATPLPVAPLPGLVPAPSAAPVGEGAAAANEAAYAAESQLPKLLRAIKPNPWLIAIGLMLYSPGLNEGETEAIRAMRIRQALDEDRLVIPFTDVGPVASPLTVNNECVKQTPENQRNGRQCEEDGHAIMRSALRYDVLATPPPGKGLDGLFEKILPLEQPAPFPRTVTTPKPGELVFLLPASTPPNLIYDYAGNPKQAIYPKFVVFEAKHIKRPMDPKGDPAGFQKEVKRRLNNTCDGVQMAPNWSDPRIPKALKRDDARSLKENEKKQLEISKAEYARWVFVCQPGLSDNQRTYVFIDVGSSPILKEIENVPPKVPKAPKPSKPAPDSGY